MMTAQLGPPPAATGRGRWTDGENAAGGAPPDGAPGFAALLTQLAGPPAETVPAVTDPLAAGPLTGELPIVTGADVAGTPTSAQDAGIDPQAALPSPGAPTPEVPDALAGPSAQASPVAHAATGAAGDGGDAVRAAVHAALLARKAEGGPVPTGLAPVTPGIAPATDGATPVAGTAPVPGAAALATTVAGAPDGVTPAPPAGAPATATAATTAAATAASAGAPSGRGAAQPAAVVTVTMSRRPEGTEAPRDVRAVPAADSAAPRPEGAPAPIAVAPAASGPASTTPAPAAEAPAMARATNAAELAHELGARMRMAVREGGRELVVSLRPAELGHLTVRVTMVDGALTAQIVADRPEAARMLQQSLGQLGTVLSEMGFQIDALDIGWTGDEAGAQAHAGEEDRPGGARADEPAPGFTLDGVPADMTPVSVSTGSSTTTSDAVGDDGLDLLV